jgi:hypothetical protein
MQNAGQATLTGVLDCGSQRVNRNASHRVLVAAGTCLLATLRL